MDRGWFQVTVFSLCHCLGFLNNWKTFSFQTNSAKKERGKLLTTITFG